MQPLHLPQVGVEDEEVERVASLCLPEPAEIARQPRERASGAQPQAALRSGIERPKLLRVHHEGVHPHFGVCKRRLITAEIADI